MHQQLRLQKYKQERTISVVAANLHLRPTQRYCKAARAILVCYCTIEALMRRSGGFAEAVQLRRRYAVMKEAARARRR